MKAIIANPIYDSVFKFLMEDPEVARVILSELLQREVVEVVMKNNEYTKKVNGSISVFRIDFGARVRDCNGNIENVNIELQKAWLTTEIMRFRNYLAEQYADKNNRFVISDKPLKDKPLHIVNIYLLGHEVENLENAVTYVYPKMYDQHGNDILTPIKNVDFVNELVHDAIIVQIPKISKMEIKTKLDRLLSIFDQEFVMPKSTHNLIVESTDYDRDYKCVFNRLLLANADEQIAKEMQLDDEYQTILVAMEMKEAAFNEKLDEKNSQLAEKDTQIAEKDTQIAEKDTQIAEKDTQIAEKDTQIAGKDAILKNMAKMLMNLGKSSEEIAISLNVEKKTVEEWLS